MSEQYTRDLLRVSIAQICQTIGYNAIHTTPLELLQDNLHKFLHEFCRDLRRHVEHYNRTEANLDDVYLTLSSLSINVNELLEYIFNVQPVAFAIDIPKFPIHKESNLNFLKPGSKEVLVRPVHIYEHLPPILANEEFVESVSGIGLIDKSVVLEDSVEDGNVAHIIEVKSDHILPTENTQSPFLKNETERSLFAIKLKDKENVSTLFKVKSNSMLYDDEGRPTREIGSVMMTSGGFISPAIEGKLANARIPNLIDVLEGLDAPPPEPQSYVTNYSRTSVRTPIIPLKSEVEQKTEPCSSTLVESSPSATDVALKQIHPPGSTGGIVNACPSVISAAAALRLAKRIGSTQNLAPRILKKTKKKGITTSIGKAEKQILVGSDLDRSSEMNEAPEDLNDKVQKKRMKMLQKLVKSAKSAGGDITGLVGGTGKLKNINSFYNPSVVNSMPPGPERLQIEKFLKKQAKYKQKLLKHQIPNNPKPLPKIEEQLKYQYLESKPDQSSTGQITMVDESNQGDSSLCNLSIKTSCSIDNVSPLKLSKQNTSVPSSSSNLLQGYKNNKNDSVFGEGSSTKQIKETDGKIPEIKLSTEPDRSKLNILKKISSKQKQLNRVPSPMLSSSASTQIFSETENQVINLPSGTTITPAPPTSGRHVYAPKDDSSVTAGERSESSDVKTNVHTTTNIFHKVSVIGDKNMSMNLMNKPKKRGRKPGSKNQPKVQGVNLMSGNSNSKKSKKLKLQKHIYGPQIQLPSQEHSSEPLNLSHSLSPAKDINTNIPLGIATTFPMYDNIQRKERKKKQGKDSMTPSENISSPNLKIQHQQRISIKKLSDSFSAPTQEEVDSINRKLLKMDTVLQPAPPLDAKTENPTENTGVSTMDTSLSPTSSTKPKNVSHLSLPNSSLEGSPISQAQAFPNLPPNMLSMLPLYPFPSRPGLIPTAGLFPPVFPNPPSNVAPNMLLQGFLPFSGLKSASSGHLRSPGVKFNDNTDNTAEPSVDRNYCNVAPLVPDSVKLKLSPGISLNSPKQGVDKENPKTPQLKPSPSKSETLRDSVFQKLSVLGTPDSSSWGSKSIPPTPGGLSLNTFDNLMRCGNSVSSISSNLSNAMVPTDSFKQSESSRNVQTISTLNANDPIEVSDDSGDAPVSLDISKSKNSTIQRPYVKPTTNPVTLPWQIDDIFIPNDTTTIVGVNQPNFLFSSNNKQAKKLKKHKLSKKSPTSSVASSSSFETVSVSNVNENAVGKLAGGADLIPLTTTGMSYSSKVIPTNSLTASTKSTSFEIARDCLSVDILETTTVISTDTQSKRKDHKKNKKIKYGKIKKKKDKKDKNRSKDKIEKRIKGFVLDKHYDKDLLKKMKKDKKKEKQRSARESLSSPTSKHGVTSGGFDINSTSLSNVSPFSTTIPPIGSISSVVPKLTLKLGGCQSPVPYDDMKQKPPQKSAVPSTSTAIREPSPELARISPLVTRPPKQKVSSLDSHSVAVEGMASSGNNIHGTFNNELFGENGLNTTGMNVSISNTAFHPTPSSWSTGGTLTASSTLLPQQLLQSSVSKHTFDEPLVSAASVASTSARSTSIVQNPVPLLHENNRPSSYIDAEGNRVWICPACGKVDDGSAMIGCDGCDAWYHWVCVGIFVAPKDNEDWFCRVCIAKKKGTHITEKKRKRNKKNK